MALQEYRVENANGVLREIEAPTHRQIDSHLMEGFHNQPQDIVGFFQGNNLPRPSGLNSLGGFSGLVPSDGFEPDPPVGGPSPFINPEFSAPHHPPDFGPQAPRPPPAPPNSPAPHSDSPDTHIPLTIIIGPTGKGSASASTLLHALNRKTAFSYLSFRVFFFRFMNIGILII